ncbi:ABC transporter substrate-binding protein [Breoghania sp. JC706]|uniref:ABC transporter substrate-binding protein n=1 Tax=Breoghania sp. JC706 TaxID=3117732 RepID=UPI00300A200A
MKLVKNVIPALVACLAVALAAEAGLAGEKTVTDDTGRTVTVPERPERIVVLHEPLLGVPIIDIGGPVVGSYGRTDEGKVLTAVNFVTAVLGPDAPQPRSGIGAIGAIDLERLRALHPDLIVSTEHDRDKADQLSAVAPVYLQASSTGEVHGFSAQADLAKLIGREDAFARREADYRARLEKLRASLAEDPEGKTYLAVMISDQASLVGNMSGLIQAVEDLGYVRVPLDNAGAASGLGSTFAVPLSPEILGRLDPDLLIVMKSYAEADRDEAAIRARLDRIMPGWERFLKPAREGRIMFVDAAPLATPSVASAENFLDLYESWVKR